jgi:hypothetical protein
MSIDVIKLAEQAGFVTSKIFGPLVAGRPVGDELERFAALVLEEAARTCDRRYMGDNNREDMEAKRCAAAIRALKPQE